MEGRKLGFMFVCPPRVCGENKKRHKCHVCSENSPKMTLRLVHFEPSQPPAFEIQSILLNDSASLRFAEHDKDERPEACPKKMVGWLASLALYKYRAFGPRVEPSCYFKPGGGYQPDKVESNRDLSEKLGLICNQNTAGVLPNKKLVAPTSVGAASLNAVAQGFEPWVAVTPHSISSAAPSAARTRYLGTPQ